MPRFARTPSPFMWLGLVVLGCGRSPTGKAHASADPSSVRATQADFHWRERTQASGPGAKFFHAQMSRSYGHVVAAEELDAARKSLTLLDPRLTLPDSCGWLRVPSALASAGGTPIALRIEGACVHEEVPSVASETYSFTEGTPPKTGLAVRQVEERSLATRLKGTLVGPRAVAVRVDVWSSFTDVRYSTPHGSVDFKGTTLAELDAKIGDDLAAVVRAEVAATSTWMGDVAVAEAVAAHARHDERAEEDALLRAALRTNSGAADGWVRAKYGLSHAQLMNVLEGKPRDTHGAAD